MRAYKENENVGTRRLTFSRSNKLNTALFRRYRIELYEVKIQGRQTKHRMEREEMYIDLQFYAATKRESIVVDIRKGCSNVESISLW